MRFSADDEFGCELRVLQIGKDQNGKPAVVAKVQAQGIVPFGVRNSAEREKANAEHQNHCGKAKYTFLHSLSVRVRAVAVKDAEW